MARRAKRKSPLLMSMHHQRSVRPQDRLWLRRKLHEAMGDASEALVMEVARAATLSGPEALRMLDMAAERHEDLDAAQVEAARGVIERLCVTP